MSGELIEVPGDSPGTGRDLPPPVRAAAKHYGALTDVVPMDTFGSALGFVGFAVVWVAVTWLIPAFREWQLYWLALGFAGYGLYQLGRLQLQGPETLYAFATGWVVGRPRAATVLASEWRTSKWWWEVRSGSTYHTSDVPSRTMRLEGLDGEQVTIYTERAQSLVAARCERRNILRYLLE